MDPLNNIVTHDRVVFVIYLGPVCINKTIPSKYKQIGVENELRKNLSQYIWIGGNYSIFKQGHSQSDW